MTSSLRRKVGGYNQVGHDLILPRALLEMFSDPTLASAFAGRGGTALHKLLLPNPLRYSDDLDLVQVTPGPLGTVLTALRGRLDPLLGPSASERSPSTHSVLGDQARPFHLASPWATGTVEITTDHPDELCAAKLIRPAFRNDSLPLLPPNAAYDPDGADERVRRAVIDRWPVA